MRGQELNSHTGSGRSCPELWAHQREAVERARGSNFFALFFEMGTGKTGALATILKEKIVLEKKKLPTLIVAPVVTHDNWIEELEVFSGLGKFAAALNGSTKQKLKAARQAKAEGKYIFITNQEALLPGPWEQVLKTIGQPAVLVVDESQGFKNPKSKRTKTALAIASKAKYKYILSGSPVVQSPLDLWSQMRLLDKRVFPGNFYTFRGQYFHDANEEWKDKQTYFPNWRLNEGAEQQISQVIKPHSLRATKKECLDLPELLKVSVPVKLTAEQARLYKDMCDHYVAECRTGEIVTAELAITKTLRLQQILSGLLKTPEGKTKIIASGKEDALRRLLEEVSESGSKVIIWSAWTDTYAVIEGICIEAGMPFVALTGRESASEKLENQEKFRNDSGYPVCIANAQAAGRGVNLTEASYSIYYSKTYNLEHDVQSEARNYRGGSEQHQKITRYDLVCPGTIDEDIDNALKEKLRCANLILNFNKRVGLA